jgi:hypothetical protein
MRLLTTIFILISTYCFSQKQYEFDYLLEYEMTFYKDSIKNQKFRKEDQTIKKYYFTNSKKNNYSAVITELDSLNYKMIFKDEKGIFSAVTFLKSDLNKAEFINIGCKSVTRYKNPFKYQTKNYDFFKLNDTIIDGKNYWMYKLESIKPKRVKRKKLGTEFYIIDKGTLFHLPVLTFSTAYEEWKKEGNLPNGIFQQKYFIDYFGQLVIKEKLINYWKINKKIVITNDCDYTENK